MLRLPYQPGALDPRKPVPPSLPSAVRVRWRPLIHIRIIGSNRRYWDFDQALLDTGADDTVFPLHIANMLGVSILPDRGHSHTWRGTSYRLHFGRVHLELTDDISVWRWPAIVAFTEAAVRYPLLGHCGFMEYIETRFLDADRVVELEPNTWYPGST